MTSKFQYINLPNTAGINIAFDSDTSGLFYAQSVPITGTPVWNPVMSKDAVQIIQIAEANKDSVSGYVSDHNIKHNIIFVDEYGQSTLYLAATSSIIDISQEFISEVSAVTSDNIDKLITVNAMSGYLESKIESKFKEFEGELDALANDKFISSGALTNGVLTLTYNTEDPEIVIPLSDALTGKVDLTTFENALTDKVDLSTFEETLQGKVDTSTFENTLTGKVNTSTFEETSSLLQTNINNKLNTDVFNSVSGNYIGADNKLSSDLTSAFTEANKTLSSNLLGTIDGLNTRFTLSGNHENTDFASVYTLLYDGKQIGDSINIPKDQFLSGAQYIPSSETLQFTFAINKKSKNGRISTSAHIVDIPVSGLVHEYEGGNGINVDYEDLAGATYISIKKAPTETNDNKFINLTDAGLGLSGITEFVNSVSGQLQDSIDDKLNIADFNTVSGQLQDSIVNLPFAQIVKLPETYLATSEGILNYFKTESDVETSKNTLFIDKDGQTALYFAATSSIIDISQEVISDASSVTDATNSEKLMTVNAITGYVESKVSSKLNTSVFQSVSGNYLTADVELSGALTGYIDSNVSSKLDINTFNTLSTQIVTGYQEANEELIGIINQLTYSQIIKLPENYTATESDIISFFDDNSKADKTKDILFVDTDGQTALYFAASNTATSSIVDISQEFISEASDVTAANSGKLMTVKAVSSYIKNKISSKLNTSVFQSVSGNYLAADVELSGALTGYIAGISGNLNDKITNLTYSKVIKLPSEYAANKSGIETYFDNNSTLDKSKDILFVDVNGQTAIWIASDETINDISVEYINKVSSITAANSSKLMTVNAITGYVEGKVSSKLDTNTFNLVSGNYIDADNKLSSAVTSYVNDQVENKAELVFNDNIPTMGELGKIYISADGAVAVAKTNNGPTTNLSLNVVSEMLTYTESDEVIPTAGAIATYVDGKVNTKQDKLTIAETVDNNDYIPTNAAVSAFVDGKVNTKQDKLIIAETVTNNTDIPNNKAVSAFVDNKLNNKIASTVANNNNIPTNKAVSSFVESKLSTKVNTSELNNYYTSTIIDSKLSDKLDNTALDNYYTSTIINTLLEGKQDTFTPATSITTSTANSIPTNKAVSSFVDTKISGKVNASELNNYYTSTIIDTLLEGKQNTLTIVSNVR